MAKWTRFYYALGLGFILMVGASLYARNYESDWTPDSIVKAAEGFSGAFTPEQRAKLIMPFDSDERLNWHYVPKVRAGVPFKEMDGSQKHLAHALMSTVLSTSGYLKVSTVMSLEMILRDIETKAGDAKASERRDPDLYYFALFGAALPEFPYFNTKENWGLRIEGHHVSLNFTLIGDRIVSAPLFLGANPHVVPEGPRKGLRVLATEDDLGWKLMQLLTEDQRKVAVLDPKAPPDIFTRNSRKADLQGAPKGLGIDAMNDEQKAVLQQITDAYVATLPHYLQEQKMEWLLKYKSDSANQVYFAWMGSTDKGQRNYYRIQTPTYLIEFDNTAEDANHTHAVWREFNGDFGLDLLAEHHAQAHAGTQSK